MSQYCYRVRLTPLEYYHFSNEQNAWVNHREQYKREVPYYISSDFLPSQTTILGMLRYYLLKNIQPNLLGFGEQIDERAKNERIGPKSFDLESEIVQSFGLIHSLSPIYISNLKQNAVYLPRPDILEKKDDQIRTLSITRTLNGDSYLEGFLAKENSKFKYEADLLTIPISGDGTVELSNSNDIFISSLKARVNKAKRQKNRRDDGAFFKVEMKKMASDYSFEFFLTLSKELDVLSDIVYMGSYKSAFEIELIKVDKAAYGNFLGNIQTKLSQFITSKKTLYYALSDVYFPNLPQFDLSIGSKKFFRNLKAMNNAAANERYVANNLGLMFEKGSVFYSDDDLPENWQCQQIGLNTLIKIGETK